MYGKRAVHDQEGESSGNGTEGMHGKKTEGEGVGRRQKQGGCGILRRGSCHMSGKDGA